MACHNRHCQCLQGISRDGGCDLSIFPPSPGGCDDGIVGRQCTLSSSPPSHKGRVDSHGDFSTAGSVIAPCDYLGLQGRGQEGRIPVSPNGWYAAHTFSFQPVAPSQLADVNYLLAEAARTGDETPHVLLADMAPVHNYIGLIASLAGPLTSRTHHNALRPASDTGFHHSDRLRQFLTHQFEPPVRLPQCRFFQRSRTPQSRQCFLFARQQRKTDLKRSVSLLTLHCSSDQIQTVVQRPPAGYQDSARLWGPSTSAWT